MKEVKPNVKEDFRLAKKVMMNSNPTLLSAGKYEIYRPYFASTQNLNYISDLTKKMDIKSAFTILGSGEPVFELISQDVDNIIATDTNPFTKYIYYLKKAAIKTLSNKEYVSFMLDPYNNNFLSKKLISEKVSSGFSKKEKDYLEFWDKILNYDSRELLIYGFFRPAFRYTKAEDRKLYSTYIHTKKYDQLKEAFALYRGHLLPEIYSEEWVIVNSARFQNLYTACLEELIEIMKKKGDYQDMYNSCNYAASLYPLDEWQVYEMEALVALGETKAALALYEKTTEMYFEELSMPPSDQMLECFQHMKDQLNMKTRDINEIQSGMEEKEFFKGAFFCQYPSFADSYRMMNRIMERSGQSVYLLMCTLHDEKEQMEENTELFKELSEKLFDSIQESLRRGDIFTKYNLKQYLVMLIGIRKEECSIVTSRIDSSFRKKCNNKHIKIHYHISSVATGVK